jgi:hypothetical protein
MLMLSPLPTRVAVEKYSSFNRRPIGSSRYHTILPAVAAGESMPDDFNVTIQKLLVVQGSEI